jgi:hypothetical protein
MEDHVPGLHRLRHEVLYLEDTGRWCDEPRAQTFIESGQAAADYLRQHLTTLDKELSQCWFFRDALGRTYGRSWDDVKALCRACDLFIHISAATIMREEYLGARRRVFIDSDPMYTQSRADHKELSIYYRLSRSPRTSTVLSAKCHATDSHGSPRVSRSCSIASRRIGAGVRAAGGDHDDWRLARYARAYVGG